MINLLLILNSEGTLFPKPIIILVFTDSSKEDIFWDQG